MSSKTRSKKEESPPEPRSLIPSLPEDIIIDIIAHVESCYYPTLSLVSKHFRSLVASHELYERRSALGCTEHRLYVVLRGIGDPQLYILRRKANGSHRLFLIITSLLKTHFPVSFVTVGSSIYVFSKLDSIPPKRISINCRSQDVHPLPSMNVTMSVSFVCFMDGKIFVVGYSHKPRKRVMAVFNVETQVWEDRKELPDTARGYNWTGECVVMGGKMYTRDRVKSIVYVYEPKENKWDTDNMLNMFNWYDATVVDDVLYYYDGTYGRKVLRAYDPKESSWLVVNGLEELVAPDARFSYCAGTGSFGGKLFLFFSKDYGAKTQCAQISLERRHQGSEIWGKIDCCDDVLVGGGYTVMKSLDVIV